VVAGGVGDAGDDVSQVWGGQPLRRAAFQDTVALHALAGDDQDGAEALVPGPRQEPLQYAARPVLIEAVQIEPSADRVPLLGDAVLAARLDDVEVGARSWPLLGGSRRQRDPGSGLGHGRRR